MKSKLLVHLCFLIPFVLTAFNAQVLVSTFISIPMAQFMAYANMGLIIVGIALVIKERGELSKTASLWLVFFLLYFSIGIWAGAVHYNDSKVLLTTIPFIYAVGFYYYLSLPGNRKLFEYVALVSFILACVVCIYWDHINFDLDFKGVYIYVIDRAQGVYGDANNMALVAIISFIFVYKIFNPTLKILKVVKLLLLALTAYSLFITFSNTGFMVFVISLVLLNYKFFKGIRILIGITLLPVVYFLLLNLNNLTSHINLVGQQRDKINNIVNMVSLNFDKVDDSGRIELVQELMQHIYENPIFGNGVDFANLHQAHNTFLAVWADAGILVLLFFLFTLGRYFVKAIQSPPDIRFFVIPIMITLCTFMLSLHSVINQPYIMALFMYMGYLLDKKTNDNQETLPENEISQD